MKPTGLDLVKCPLQTSACGKDLLWSPVLLQGRRFKDVGQNGRTNIEGKEEQVKFHEL